MKACLQQPMFCSRESPNCLIIQQNEKSTQKNTTFICHAPVVYLEAKNMPLKYHNIMPHVEITWCALVEEVLIHATYDVTGINHATRSAVHIRRQRQCRPPFLTAQVAIGLLHQISHRNPVNIFSNVYEFR